ncbi:hypothetical protein [Streptomyces sp. NPDC002537]
MITTLLLLPLGVLVGAAEFAVCGLLSTVVAGAVRREPVGEGTWMAVVGSDALRPCKELARRLPRPAAVVALVLVGLAQEALLRAGVFAVAGGDALAVPLSAALTPLVAVATVRGVEARALAALAGAVTGTVHALLYAGGHAVLPLAVAEGTFLALCVL